MIAKDNTRVRAWDQHGREVAPGALDPGPRPDNIITRRIDAADRRRKATRT